MSNIRIKVKPAVVSYVCELSTPDMLTIINSLMMTSNGKEGAEKRLHDLFYSKWQEAKKLAKAEEAK